MLSPTQEEIYESGKDFVIGKLDLLLSKCNTSEGKAALCFVVGITLTNDFVTTQKILNQVYPGEPFNMVRSLFETIHKLINGNDPNHTIIKPICDPRLFTAKDESIETTQQALVKASAEKLSADVRLWNNDKYQQGIFIKADFKQMCASHSAILFYKDESTLDVSPAPK